ncbi:ParB/RepB/Spo0J family partition protein [Actinomyces ihuae]|uniref:ParB/RepB/Spo0J family partition protein n=2 Tax=Actinomycetaceae TaxID=2049 RepID=UPI0035327B63
MPRSDAGHAGTGDAKSDLVEVPGATFAEIPTQWIVPNTRQPRSVFDEDDLNELAASIREVGVLQPIVIRPIEITSDTPDTLREYIEEKPEARYELIMGERRLRASEIAEVDTIPAIIRRTQDEDLLRDALLENLHRAQLNPLEEASAYAQLMEDFGATQEELSRRIARSRPQIANTLRLLKLPPAVQRKVASGVISAGHARALLSLSTPDEMELLADRIVAEGLSVRTTEEIARLNKPKPARVQRILKPQQLSELGRHVAAELSDLCDTRVTVNEGSTKGKIVIEFAGAQDLERIAAVLLAQAR